MTRAMKTNDFGGPGLGLQPQNMKTNTRIMRNKSDKDVALELGVQLAVRSLATNHDSFHFLGHVITATPATRCLSKIALWTGPPDRGYQKHENKMNNILPEMQTQITLVAQTWVCSPNT